MSFCNDWHWMTPDYGRNFLAHLWWNCYDDMWRFIFLTERNCGQNSTVRVPNCMAATVRVLSCPHLYGNLWRDGSCPQLYGNLRPTFRVPNCTKFTASTVRIPRCTEICDMTVRVPNCMEFCGRRFAFPTVRKFTAATVSIPRCTYMWPDGSSSNQYGHLWTAFRVPNYTELYGRDVSYSQLYGHVTRICMDIRGRIATFRIPNCTEILWRFVCLVDLGWIHFMLRPSMTQFNVGFYGRIMNWFFSDPIATEMYDFRVRFPAYTKFPLRFCHRIEYYLWLIEDIHYNSV